MDVSKLQTQTLRYMIIMVCDSANGQ